MLDETTYPGIGKTERRRVIQRWKEEGKPLGLSLKQWAAQQHPVGDAAFNWLQAKKRRG
ncbi:MAG: hypothetical protein RIF41_02265 [Polyangiaceae bacterium]|jgi:hypothetical protein